MTSAVSGALRPIPIPAPDALRRDPAAQAFMLLRIVFTVAPILFGLDKFAGVLTDDWTRYLSTQFNDIIPGSAQDAMYAVGVVEVVAGLTVLVAPRFGGLLVAAWLGGIILNLLLVGGYGDIALRDFGLLAGALAMSRLASAEPRGRLEPRGRGPLREPGGCAQQRCRVPPGGRRPPRPRVAPRAPPRPRDARFPRDGEEPRQAAG